MQRIEDDVTEEPRYEFEAQLKTSTFCTGPVTFVVPSVTPEIPYNMYGAVFNETDSAWHILPRSSSLSTSTFPAPELFPDFSNPLPGNRSEVRDEAPLEQDESQIPVAIQPTDNESRSIEADENDSSASSGTLDQAETPSATDTSISWADLVEEEEEQKAAAEVEAPGKSWAEEMDAADESASMSQAQDPQQPTGAPLPSAALSVDAEDQDAIKPAEHVEEMVTEEASSDQDVIQAMIDELRTPWNPNLRAFIPKDISIAYNHYFNQANLHDPRLVDPDSRKWHQLCKINAEWYYMGQASTRIKEEFNWDLPRLRQSHCGPCLPSPPTTSPPATPSHYSKPSLDSFDDDTHHYNLLERRVKTHSITPIEISFWATHSTGLINKDFKSLRPQVCAAQAATWIDPFHVITLVQEYDGSRWLTGSELVKAATGRLRRVYSPGGAWRNPEDALSILDVPHYVNKNVVPVQPVTPPIINNSVHGDVVVNDDGRAHPVHIKKGKVLGFSRLRHVKLCYEDDETSEAHGINPIEQSRPPPDTIANMFMNEPTDSDSEEGDECTGSAIAASVGRPPTRRMLRPRSPRLLRTMIRRPESSLSCIQEEEDVSDAETEIITDSHPSASAAHITFTCADETRTNDRASSGVRVSEWVDTFAESPDCELIASRNNNNEDAYSQDAAYEEDGFLYRLSQENPQNIIVLDDDVSESESEAESDQYSPTAQTPYSPVTNSSTYNDGSDGEDERQQDTYECTNTTQNENTGYDGVLPDVAMAEEEEALSVDIRNSQETITTDLVVYRGPITFEHLPHAHVELGPSYYIAPFAIRSEPIIFNPISQLIEAERDDEEIKADRKSPSDALVPYRGSINFEAMASRLERKDEQLASPTTSESITIKARCDELPITCSNVFHSGPLALGHTTAVARHEDTHTSSSTSSQPITSTPDTDVTTTSKPSPAAPKIHDVDLSSIPIFSFNDVAEIPKPSPSAPERFYGKLNIAIGRAGMKAWKFLSPSSHDWSINMGSTGGEDGYLWERDDRAWRAVECA